MSSEELQLPEFPSLAQALVIEARHGSRIEILGDLNSTNLFEIVTEAKSLEEAESMLVFQSYDACFVGPSMTPAKAAKYIEKGIEASRAKDCTFVALVNRLAIDGEEGEQIMSTLQESGVHGIIERPCMKTVLRDEVIKAVVTCNADHPWAGLLLSSLGDDEEALEKYGIKVGGDLAKRKAAKKKKSLMSKVLRETAEGLKELAQGAEGGRYGLGPDGEPTQKTLTALKEITDKTLSSLDKDFAESFKDFFEDVLTAWIVDYINIDIKTATENLQQKLLSFSD